MTVDILYPQSETTRTFQNYTQGEVNRLITGISNMRDQLEKEEGECLVHVVIVVR